MRFRSHHAVLTHESHTDTAKIKTKQRKATKVSACVWRKKEEREEEEIDEETRGGGVGPFVSRSSARHEYSAVTSTRKKERPKKIRREIKRDRERSR